MDGSLSRKSRDSSPSSQGYDLLRSRSRDSSRSRSKDSDDGGGRLDSLSPREAAEQDPEQSRRALKDEIERTRTLYHWIIKFQKTIDLKDQWVQKGLQTLGISKDQLETSFTEFLSNPLLTQEIREGPAVSDIVEGNPSIERPAYDINKLKCFSELKVYP